MIPGLATSFNKDGSERKQYCEIVRVLRDAKKVLVKFPGNPRVYVKAIANVEIKVRGQFTGIAA